MRIFLISRKRENIKKVFRSYANKIEWTPPPIELESDSDYLLLDLNWITF